MPWYNPITWLPKPVKSASGPPKAADVPTKPEQKELAKIVPEMRADYQVTFCEHILTANVAAVEVTVTGDNPVLVEKCQALWDESMSAMADDIAYGRVAFELEWDQTDEQQFPRKMEAFAFEDSWMKLEDDGSFGGIEYRTKANGRECVAPVNSWWLAIDATAKYPHGRSRFMDAPHEVWLNKRGAVDNRRTATRKWALRGPVISGPAETIDPQTQQPRDTLQFMAPAIDVWSKGGLLFLPNDLHPSDQTKPAWEVVQADLDGFDPNALNLTIDRLDVEMLRAFGIPEKTVIEGQSVGSYAMITQQMLILFAVIEDIVSQRTRSFKRYVLAKVEQVNGLPKGALDISFVKLTNRPDAFVYEVIKLLLANPGFQQGLMTGGLDVVKVMKDAGLPVSEDVLQRINVGLQSVQAVNGAAPPTAPGEFGDMGRRQLQNNLKAIRDILEDLIGGRVSETMARELLQSLGLSPERVDRLMADAQDNATIDDPELQQAARTMSSELFFLSWDSAKHPRDKNGQFVSSGILDDATKSIDKAIEVRDTISEKDLPGFDQEMQKAHGPDYGKAVKSKPTRSAPGKGTKFKSPAKAESQLSSGMKPWEDKLDFDDQMGLKGYAGTAASFDVNDGLRSGKFRTPTAKVTAERMTKALDKASFPEDTVTFRSINPKTPEERASILAHFQKHSGKEFTDKAFVSSTANEGYAATWGKNAKAKPIKVEMIVPKGAKAAYLSKGLAGRQEWEVVTQRGSRFRVHEVAADGTVRMELLK